MSWHTSALIIRGDHREGALDLLSTIGFPGLQRSGEVDGDTAGSSMLEGKAVGFHCGWTLVWDPMMFLTADPSGAFEEGLWPRSVEKAVLGLSRASDVYGFVTEGTSGTHGFALYRGGHRVRAWLAQEGATVLDEGATLPEEQEARAEEDDDEQFLFVLLRNLTGVRLGETLASSFDLYA